MSELDTLTERVAAVEVDTKREKEGGREGDWDRVSEKEGDAEDDWETEPHWVGEDVMDILWEGEPE